MAPWSATLIGFSLYPQRMAATVIGIFGVTGLLVAAIGLYGVLAFHVSSRTREIGIRMALGAPLSGAMRIVLGDSVRLVLVGTAVGLLGAVALAPLLPRCSTGSKSPASPSATKARSTFPTTRRSTTESARVTTTRPPRA